MDQKKSTFSRRHFVKGMGVAAAGLTVVPSNVIAGLGHTPPSDKLNIAGIGIAGRGASVVKAIEGHNIVALCDVDFKYAQHMFDLYPNAKRYSDYRKLFDEMKDSIDAVVVGTPDHTHAIISISAMKMGKHVYCEKPLTHSVYESRMMTKFARENKVATQMGNQGNSGEGIRQICEWIWDGAIGEIEKVYSWTNRPIWPQGLDKPTEKHRVPKTLNWDAFIGPAKFTPYNSIYHPWNWRGWWDFGTGALGDMACHIMDPIFKALKLQYPYAVQASSTQLKTDCAPVASTVKLKFPRRDNLPKVGMPPVEIIWSDGGILPFRPDELPEGELMGRDPNGGCLFIGTKGKIMCGCYARNPFLLPLSLDKSYTRPKQTLRRVPGNDTSGHVMDWIRACKESPENRTPASSNFDYSGPLNEMVVMGVVATRLQSLNRELQWDGKNMKFTNISDNDVIKAIKKDHFKVVDGHPHIKPEYEEMNAKQAAEEYIKHTYREGWSW